MSTDIEVMGAGPATVMTEYQAWVETVSWYQNAGTGNMKELVYLILGLAGEAGEAADVVKKTVRTDGVKNRALTEVLVRTERKDAFISELGDVLWYLAGLLNVLDLTFEDLAEMNREKLTARMKK